MDKYTVLKDNKEKSGWFFYPDKDCAGMKDVHLKTADYTIEGLEELLCIERKKTVAELSQNITELRFAKEIERMMKFKYRYIICEFDMYKITVFPKESGLPEHIIKKLKIPPGYIKLKISEYERAGIKVILAGNKYQGFLFAKKIFKEVYDAERRTTE